MIRYYPSFRIITNQFTSGGEYTLKGKPYKGKYYATYDNKAFTGPTPEVGPNELLDKIPDYKLSPGLNSANLSDRSKKNLANNTGIQSNRIPGKPNNFYPQPNENDYKRGYIIRYFTKKENEQGFITEISADEYNNIVNGTTDYDISIYQVTQILWKLTGPLKNTRTSQYNIIAGIVDTNKRLTEAADKTFLGILDFIAGDYIKFARPTM